AYERLRGGRRYVFCHASSTVDGFTRTALALVAAAGVLTVLGAWTVQAVGPRRVVLPLAFMAAVAVLLVAADGVDARGEREAEKIAAQPFDEESCDYTPQVYDATPGWLFW
ncbi:hypothetical protein AB4Z54_66040, partial [Streptomyces sp. MCAF7]